MKKDVIFQLTEFIIDILDDHMVVNGLSEFWSVKQNAGYYKLINLLLTKVSRTMGTLDFLSPAGCFDELVNGFQDEEYRIASLCEYFQSYILRSPYWYANSTLQHTLIYGFSEKEDVDIPDFKDLLAFINGNLPLTEDENNWRNTCCQVFLEHLEEWIDTDSFDYLEWNEGMMQYVYEVICSQRTNDCYGFNILFNPALKEYLNFADTNISLIKQYFFKEHMLLQKILEIFSHLNIITSSDDMYASRMQINKKAVCLYWITGYSEAFFKIFTNASMCWYIPYFLMATDLIVQKAEKLFHCIKSEPKEIVTYISGMPVGCLK